MQQLIASQALTNLLLTGIMLMQAFAILFRDTGKTRNEPKFPIRVQPK